MLVCVEVGWLVGSSGVGVLRRVAPGPVGSCWGTALLTPCLGTAPRAPFRTRPAAGPTHATRVTAHHDERSTRRDGTKRGRRGETGTTAAGGGGHGTGDRRGIDGRQRRRISLQRTESTWGGGGGGGGGSLGRVDDRQSRPTTTATDHEARQPTPVPSSPSAQPPSVGPGPSPPPNLTHTPRTAGIWRC